MSKKTLTITIVLAALVSILTVACNEQQAPLSEGRAPEPAVSVEAHGTLEQSDAGPVLDDAAESEIPVPEAPRNSAAGDEPAADQKAVATNPDTVALEVTQVRIKGVVTATDTGLALVAGEKRYALKENASLDQMVGKTVILDGVVQKDENGTVLIAEQAASQIQIRGEMEKRDNGITLFDGKETYLLKGDQDLSPFAGKTVEVTGEVHWNDSGNVILVKRIAESK